MAQWDNQKLLSQSLTPGSSCFSLVFINNLNNLINDKSKHKNNKFYYLYCIVRGPSQLFITCTSL